MKNLSNFGASLSRQELSGITGGRSVQSAACFVLICNTGTHTCVVAGCICRNVGVAVFICVANEETQQLQPYHH